MRIRSAAAALTVAAVMVLASCAVPGQAGAPGTAAETPSGIITNATVAEVMQAWVDDSQGALAPTRGQVLTSLILHDAAMAALEEQDIVLSDQQYVTLATNWLALYGVEAEPSDAMMQSASTVMAITLLSESDPSLALVVQVAEAATDGLIVGPRLGPFTVDSVVQTTLVSQDQATSTFASFPPGAYLTVNGFDS